MGNEKLTRKNVTYDKHPLIKVASRVLWAIVQRRSIAVAWLQ